MEARHNGLPKRWREKYSVFCEAYRWAYPGLYLNSQGSRQRITGGELNKPTEQAGLDERRDLARKAFRILENIDVRLDKAIHLMEQAVGTWTPTDSQESRYEADDMAPALPGYLRRDHNRQLAYQQRRQERGEGYG
jgi:hypothetical protein